MFVSICDIICSFKYILINLETTKIINIFIKLIRNNNIDYNIT